MAILWVLTDLTMEELFHTIAISRAEPCTRHYDLVEKVALKLFMAGEINAEQLRFACKMAHTPMPAE